MGGNKVGNNMGNNMGNNVVPIQKGLSIEEALKKVRKGLEQIQYGEIIVKVENGKPIWVDKYERERVG
jgi:hypothetical protein